MQPLRWWAESVPLVGIRYKISENLGATMVAPVAPMDTSLLEYVLETIIYRMTKGLNPNWHETEQIYLLKIFELDFVS